MYYIFNFVFNIEYCIVSRVIIILKVIPDIQYLKEYCRIVVLLVNLMCNLQLDVFGLCPTDISVAERGDTTTITKIRNLNKCQLREHLRQDFASVTYPINSVSIWL